MTESTRIGHIKLKIQICPVVCMPFTCNISVRKWTNLWQMRGLFQKQNPKCASGIFLTYIPPHRLGIVICTSLNWPIYLILTLDPFETKRFGVIENEVRSVTVNRLWYREMIEMIKESLFMTGFKLYKLCTLTQSKTELCTPKQRKHRHWTGVYLEERL